MTDNRKNTKADITRRLYTISIFSDPLRQLGRHTRDFAMLLCVVV